MRGEGEEESVGPMKADSCPLRLQDSLSTAQAAQASVEAADTSVWAAASARCKQHPVPGSGAGDAAGQHPRLRCAQQRGL